MTNPIGSSQEEFDLSEKLEFIRGTLYLLKETNLFGPLLEKAVEDIDALIKEYPRPLSQYPRILS